MTINDHYIEEIVNNNRYKIDLNTGEIYKDGLKKKYELRDGYYTLSYKGKILKVHRIVAATKYGVEAIKNKHVHHIDEDRSNNNWTNLECVSPMEHINKHGPYPKIVIEDKPCYYCGTFDGARTEKGTLIRIVSPKYGIYNLSCKDCYALIRRMSKSTKPVKEKRIGLTPCSLCNTTGGRKSKTSARPDRYRGIRFNIEGWLCDSCYKKELYKLKNKDKPRKNKPFIRSLPPKKSIPRVLEPIQ
jgi:hypothetical protein